MILLARIVRGTSPVNDMRMIDQIEERIDSKGDTVGTERRCEVARVRVVAESRPTVSRSLRVRAVARGRELVDCRERDCEEVPERDDGVEEADLDAPERGRAEGPCDLLPR